MLKQSTGVAVLLIFGLAFSAIGAYLLFFFHKGYEGVTEAVITRIVVEQSTRDDYIHTAYVSYEVDGVSYNDIRSDYYQSSYVVGKKIKIYYDLNDPTDFRADTSFGGYIACGVGVIIFIITGVTHFRSRKEYRKTGKKAFSPG